MLIFFWFLFLIFDILDVVVVGLLLDDDLFFIFIGLGGGVENGIGNGVIFILWFWLVGIFILIGGSEGGGGLGVSFIFIGF